MGRQPAGNIPFECRVSEQVARKFKEHIAEKHLDRNLMVTLILAKYLTEQGVKADEEAVNDKRS